jgi:hypothetical protein
MTIQIKNVGTDIVAAPASDTCSCTVCGNVGYIIPSDISTLCLFNAKGGMITAPLPVAVLPCPTKSYRQRYGIGGHT